LKKTLIAQKTTLEDATAKQQVVHEKLLTTLEKLNALEPITEELLKLLRLSRKELNVNEEDYIDVKGPFQSKEAVQKCCGISIVQIDILLKKLTHISNQAETSSKLK